MHITSIEKELYHLFYAIELPNLLLLAAKARTATSCHCKFNPIVSTLLNDHALHRRNEPSEKLMNETQYDRVWWHFHVPKLEIQRPKKEEEEEELH